MNRKICVYTCITGNYDNLHEISDKEANIDYYCFTNNKNLKSKSWQIIQIEDSSTDNRLLARRIKILGHPKINKYDICVWTDADVIWTKSINDFVDQYFQNTKLAIFKHHARSTIREEALACLTFRKEKYDALIKILDYYKEINFPDNNGLCESTVFIKAPQDSLVMETMETWYNMVKNYTGRDQLSFNYAIWKTNLQPKYINLNVWDNHWFQTSKHLQKQEIHDCYVYYYKPTDGLNLEDYEVYHYKKRNNTYNIKIIIPHDTKIININPFNSIGVFFNILIDPPINNIFILGSLQCKKGYISCTEYNLIQLFGDFTKGQTIQFSIKAHTPDDLIIHEALDSLWRTNNNLESKNKALILENHNFKKANAKLQKDLHDIINSKGWRILEKLRKLIPHLH